MSAYIHELVEYLKESFDTRIGIRFDLQIERIELDVSYAIPIGLILNEAITNSIKYAFAEKQEGIVKISLRHTGEDSLLLSVEDNGNGIPDSYDTGNNLSMGMNLMKGLSADIGGNFMLESKPGVKISVSFIYNPDTLSYPSTNV